MVDHGRLEVIYLNVYFVPPHGQIYFSSLLNKFRDLPLIL